MKNIFKSQKTVAMIPARANSSRVPRKNFRLLNDKPLIEYIIESVILANSPKGWGCYDRTDVFDPNFNLHDEIFNTAGNRKLLFDEIYINSENEIFEEIAEKYKDFGVKFYKRPKKLSTSKITNDPFALDFIEKIKCDNLFQFLPTSPFLKPSTIHSFCEKAYKSRVDTLVSVKPISIECLYKDNPINFEQKEITPNSQDMEPVYAYACSPMFWKAKTFKENMQKYGAAYHGGDGKTKKYIIDDPIETIDIDYQKDWEIAEGVAMYLQNQSLSERAKKSTFCPPTKRFFNAKSKTNAFKFPDLFNGHWYKVNQNTKFDKNRHRVLIEDGLCKNIKDDDVNYPITPIQEIIDKNPKDESWSHTVINSPSNCATLIAQMPGEGNRLHHHNNWDEWWHIIDGTWKYYIESPKKKNVIEEFTVKAGDIVFIARGNKHKIECIGGKQAIRLAVSREDINHIYGEVGGLIRSTAKFWS